MTIPYTGRRGLMLGTAGLAAAAIRPARAEVGGDLSVANWGGDWNERCERVLEKPFLEPKGVHITHDLIPVPERKTKLLAERRLPRSSLDVVHLSDADAYEMNEAGVLDELDLSKLPNYGNIRPSLKLPYMVTWIFGGVVMMYNPAKIKDAPTSFADLWNPKYAGKVGIMDQLYFNWIYAASLINGGTMSDVSKAFPALVEMKKAVQPRIYASHQELAAGFANEEVWISLEYNSRIIQWMKEKMSVAWTYPKEGALLVAFGATIPKRSRNKDTAYFYLNEMVSPKVSGGIGEATSYAPATINPELPADVLAKLDFTPEQTVKMHAVDYAFAAKSDSQWVDWWNKNIKS